MENKSKVELPSIKINGFQDYISMGYLALLLMGIFRETIYYRILGVNILSYSSLIDVLLSPIALLTEHIVIIVSLIVIVGFFTYFLNRKNKSDEKKTLIYWLFVSTPLFLMAFFGMIVGNTISKGIKAKNKIKAKEYKMNHQILFNDNEKIDVKIIGQNSDYVFYVTESNDQISISPIKENIKKIEKLKEDKE